MSRDGQGFEERQVCSGYQPGDTVMVTRRTLRRHHLFRPDSAIRQLYLYPLAVSAREFGILVHGVTLMSTHEHLVFADPKRRCPDFLLVGRGVAGHARRVVGSGCYQ